MINVSYANLEYFLHKKMFPVHVVQKVTPLSALKYFLVIAQQYIQIFHIIFPG